MSQHLWYVTFWLSVGVVALTPIYVLLFKILQKL